MKSKTLMSISAVVVWFAAASFVHAADPRSGDLEVECRQVQVFARPSAKEWQSDL